MASNASGSESSSASTSAHALAAGGSLEQTEVEQRPQAGPLPAKTPRLVGELGYLEHAAGLQDVEAVDRPNDDMEGLNAAEADALNGRHPADRSHVNLTSPSTTTLANTLPSSTGQAQVDPNQSTSSLNTASKYGKFSFRSFSSCITTKKYGGVTVKTLIRLYILGITLAGIIVAWVFAARHLVRTPIATGNTTTMQSNGTSAIFIHVAFAIIVLIMIIFLERAVFQFRAERYAHLHHGQMLPSHRHRTGTQVFQNRSHGMPFAPWNRPPLPTYAAALGVRGTGDVEDTIIAAPPPPAYGNVRGSTLILASLLRNSSHGSHRSRMGAQNSDAPWQMVGRPGEDGRMSRVSTRSVRPISYDESEHRSDVERARILEETLTRLEDSTGNER